MKTALVFSGQGSQYVGMMKDINEKYPNSADLIKKADDILGFELSKICFDGPIEVLKETRYTQPAIFLHSAVCFNLVSKKLQFDAVAGHSVGEYAALYGAGVLDFESALKLVAKRGELMFEAGNELPGTMFAVLNLDDEKLIEICSELSNNNYGSVVVAANFNSPGQVVVSGSRDYLRENVGKFKEAGAKLVKELVVSGAFHSPLMAPAKKELESVINSTKFYNATVPVYTNVGAKPVTNADEIRESLIEQLTSPVLWTQSVKNMYSGAITKFIEIGPGSVLQGLIKRTVPEPELSGIDKANDVEKYL